MKVIFLFLILLLVTCVNKEPSKIVVEEERVVADDVVDTLQVLAQFLKPTFKNDSIIDWVQGDLNEDGVPDFLVVLQSLEEDPDITGMDETYIRTLLIIETDGEFPNLLVSRINNSIIDCSTCGAGVGDPYYGVYIDSAGFLIEDFYGSCDKTYTIRRFEYESEMKEWYLKSIVQDDYSCNEIDESGSIDVDRKITTELDFGKVKFQDY